jgi:hypothetical protein
MRIHAKQIEAKEGSEGFGEEQQIRTENEDDAPDIERLRRKPGAT